MSAGQRLALDWDRIALVVFDMDGTLYDARRLRWRMAAWLLADALRRRSLQVPRALAAFRRMREALADAGLRTEVDFLRLQYRLPAQRVGCRPGELQAWVEDWMEQRPLRLLADCRRPGVQALFDALHAQGKRVGVLSDYPAQEKLAALGLEADIVVWAGDAGVGRLKPDPRGLRQILARTGISAERTLVVGDRADRDGAVAARVGTQAVLVGRPGRRADGAFSRWRDLTTGTGHEAEPAAGRAEAAATWVRGFDDPLFAPLLVSLQGATVAAPSH